ncbi:hypothetical protein FBU30_000703 [Linnemannia zychae]|nr:hypothetical protein FBU30_000703 [Linnemannia zychae]
MEEMEAKERHIHALSMEVYERETAATRVHTKDVLRHYNEATSSDYRRKKTAAAIEEPCRSEGSSNGHSRAFLNSGSSLIEEASENGEDVSKEGRHQVRQELGIVANNVSTDVPSNSAMPLPRSEDISIEEPDDPSTELEQLMDDERDELLRSVDESDHPLCDWKVDGVCVACLFANYRRSCISALSSDDIKKIDIADVMAIIGVFAPSMPTSRMREFFSSQQLKIAIGPKPDLPDVNVDDKEIMRSVRLYLDNKGDQAEFPSVGGKKIRIMLESLLEYLPLKTDHTVSESTFVVKYVAPIIQAFFSSDEIAVDFPNTNSTTQVHQNMKADRPDIRATAQRREILWGEVTSPQQARHNAKNQWDTFKLARYGKAFIIAGNDSALLVQVIGDCGTFMRLYLKKRGVMVLEEVNTFVIPTRKELVPALVATLPTLELMKDFKKDIRDFFRSPAWANYKAFPADIGSFEYEQSYANARVSFAKAKLKENVRCTNVAHAGRHSGSVEAQEIEVSVEDIRQGGRWASGKALINTYLSSTPYMFARSMAGFHRKPFYLTRNDTSLNNVKDYGDLMRMIFPTEPEEYKLWIEAIEREMNDFDSGAEALDRSKAPTSSSKNAVRGGESIMAYQLAQPFLLMLACFRRVILQDTVEYLYLMEQNRETTWATWHTPLFTHFSNIFNHPNFHSFKNKLFVRLKEANRRTCEATPEAPANLAPAAAKYMQDLFEHQQRRHDTDMCKRAMETKETKEEVVELKAEVAGLKAEVMGL